MNDKRTFDDEYIINCFQSKNLGGGQSGKVHRMAY